MKTSGAQLVCFSDPGVSIALKIILAGSHKRGFCNANNGEKVKEKSPLLLQLEREANSNKSDANIQAAYLTELNKYDPSLVLLRMTETGIGINEQVIKEHVKALISKGKWDSTDLMNLFKPYFTNGSTPERPLYVQQAEPFLTVLLRALGSIIFIGLLVYLLFYKGGGMGDLFNNNYVPAETNVKVTLKDVKGSEEAKEELIDIVEYLRNPSKFYRMNAKLPKGVLLTGPPGVGKTLMARAMAGEAGVPFFYVSGSEFEEALVGVGARRVRNLFQKAKESAPCIIFIDEIDAVGGRRDHPDNRTKMTLNQLLVELDGFDQNTGIVVIAATNLAKVLDPALLRPGRFDRQVLVSLPDTRARKEIIELYLSDKSNVIDKDIQYLAETTAGFSGADIFNMVNSAAIEATKKNLRYITMRLLESARENVMLGPERKSLTINELTKKNIAYHEAGHALCATYVPGDRQIMKATLVPRGNALGMVRYMLKNELLITRESLETNLIVAMGGRAAEELIFGANHVTQGASSDFDQATKLAYEMVAKYGMSDTIGHVHYADDHSISPETKHILEKEATLLVEKAYQQAKQLLKTHKNELDLLAKALLQYDTLSLNEIQQVVKGVDIKELKEQQKIEEEQLRLKEEELLALSQEELLVHSKNTQQKRVVKR